MNPANSAEALSRLQETQATSQDPNTILSGQRQQLGADAARDTVTGLRGAINNTTQLLKQVAPSVMGRTASSLVTNAQATRQIGNEQAPIAANLAEQGADYNEASTNSRDLEERAQTAANGIYGGQQDKLSYAQNLYNTLYQKERDAEAARQAELARQEQIRQFNANQSAASRDPIADALRDWMASQGGGNNAASAKPSLDSIFGGGNLPVVQASPKSTISLQPSAPKKAVQGNSKVIQGGASRLLQGGGIRLQ